MYGYPLSKNKKCYYNFYDIKSKQFVLVPTKIQENSNINNVYITEEHKNTEVTSLNIFNDTSNFLIVILNLIKN